MDNDTRAPRRVNFLLRRVVLPGWLFLFVLVMWFYALFQELAENPLVAVLILVGVFTFWSALIARLKRHAGQPSAADDTAEVKAAPTVEASVAIAWRQMRTYQVWHVALATLVSVALLLDALGVITTP